MFRSVYCVNCSHLDLELNLADVAVLMSVGL
jgi:hypothetical protein